MLGWVFFEGEIFWADVGGFFWGMIFFGGGFWVVRMRIFLGSVFG